MTQSVTKVAVTDGGPLDLAAAILALAYGLDYTDTSAASLKTALGLGTVQAHNVETAFSYPNAVGIVVENGRTALYLYDSYQEELKVGAEVRRLDPTVVQPLPESGAATTELPTAAPAAVADAAPEPAPAPPHSDTSIDTGALASHMPEPEKPQDAPVSGEPAEPAAIAAVPPATPISGEPVELPTGVELPPPGDGSAVVGTSDVPEVAGVTAPLDAAQDPALGADLGSTVPGGPSAGDHTAPALAESEAAAAGIVRNPEDGLIDPNAETLAPTGAGELPAEAAGNQTGEVDAFADGREAFDGGHPREANPFSAESQGFEHDEWDRGWQQAETDARPVSGDQSGFHSAEG